MTHDNQGSDPKKDFLDTLDDAPEETRVLKVPEVVPVIRRGPASTVGGGMAVR